MSNHKPCPYCDGAGGFDDTDLECLDCDGTGYAPTCNPCDSTGKVRCDCGSPRGCDRCQRTGCIVDCYLCHGTGHSEATNANP